jgi:hypothetical protein
MRSIRTRLAASAGNVALATLAGGGVASGLDRRRQRTFLGRRIAGAASSIR